MIYVVELPYIFFIITEALKVCIFSPKCYLSDGHCKQITRLFSLYWLTMECGLWNKSQYQLNTVWEVKITAICIVSLFEFTPTAETKSSLIINHNTYGPQGMVGVLCTHPVVCMYFHYCMFPLLSLITEHCPVSLVLYDLFVCKFSQEKVSFYASFG